MKEMKVTSRALALSEESFSTISCTSLELTIAIIATHWDGHKSQNRIRRGLTDNLEARVFASGFCPLKGNGGKTKGLGLRKTLTIQVEVERF